MTMTQQIGPSILCAPLAATDRRALSQAWYSALRLARAKPAGTPQAAPAPLEPPVRAVARVRPPFGRSSNNAFAALPPPAVPRSPRSAPVAQGVPERRAARSALAARIVRTFSAPRVPARATFAVGASNARVHVMLQTCGRRARLVAVCAPHERPRVERALAQARFALAGRGLTLEASARSAPCW